MRVRALDADLDYTFGRGVGNFLIDTPEAVIQCVATRLRLLQGEWFLDLDEGTPWLQEVLDKGHSQTYDLVIQTRILQTKGVTEIDKYQSQIDTATRHLSISALVTTVYSKIPAQLEVTI